MRETMAQMTAPVMEAAKNIMNNTRALIAAGALAPAALAGCGLNEADPTAEKAKAQGSSGQLISKENCEAMDGFANPSSSVDYADRAYFPRAEDDFDRDSVKDYIKDNPYAEGDKLDPASLAAAMAVMTGPATKQEVSENSRDIVEAFQDNLETYASDEGLERAEEDCAATGEVLQTLGEYNDDWAQPGERVITIAAVRGKDRKITGMRFLRGRAEETLKGLEIRLNKTDSDEAKKNFSGKVGSVLILENGKMLVKGEDILPESGDRDDRRRGGGEDEDREQRRGTGRRGASGGSGPQTQAQTGGGGRGNNQGSGQTGGNGGGGVPSRGGGGGSGQPGGGPGGCEGAGKGCPGGGPGGPGGGGGQAPPSGGGGGGGQPEQPTGGGGGGEPQPQPSPTPTPEEPPKGEEPPCEPNEHNPCDDGNG